MTRLGADATGETIAQLKALGITFISRYVSDYPAKNLTPPEAQRISAAGIDLVTNWENDIDDWRGGYPRGVAYAKKALAQHAACGGPTDPAADWGIYFSTDMQIDPQDPRLHAYYDGTRSVLGVRHNGAYAQTSVLRALRSAGLIGCGEKGGTWRSMSTFGLPEGLGRPGEFDIEQTGWFNAGYDRDIANSARFGQWRIGVDPPQEADMPLTTDDGDLVAARTENRPLGTIAKPAAAVPATTTLGIETAANPARWAALGAQLASIEAQLKSLGTPPPAQVDLAALEALIEAHLASGSVPGVIAAAVLAHLSAATANAKP